MTANIWQAIDPTLAAEFSALATYLKGTVRRAIKDRAVCITDFPFYADPTGTTDSTAAIQAALDSGITQIIVPEGTFLHRKLNWPTYYVELLGKKSTFKLITGEYRHILMTATCLGVIDGITFDSSAMGTFTYNPLETYCAIGTNPIGGVLCDITVSNCKFLGLITTGQNVHAVQVSFGGATIIRNYVQQCGGDVFNCNGEQTVVALNTIDQSGDGGVAYNNRASGLIFGNKIKKCSLGIGAGPEGTTADPEHNMQILGNKITACDHGILGGWFAFAGRESIQNTLIQGNVLVDNRTSGIRNDGRAPGSPGNITISGNIVRKTGSTAYNGTPGDGNAIVSFNSLDLIVTDNQLTDNVGKGILTSESTPLIANNKIVRCGGIGIESLTADAQIRGNTVRNGTTHGISLAGNSTNIIDNIIKNNGGSGIIQTAGGVDVVILYNNIQGNLVGINVTSTAFSAGTNIGPNIVKSNTTNYVNVYSTQTAQYRRFYLTGTADGSGNITLAHGYGSGLPYQLVQLDAFIKGNSGEAVRMTLTGADATNLILTSSVIYAGRAVRVCVVVDPAAAVW